MNISYVYTVLGKKYNGNRLTVIRFSHRYNKDAQKLIEQYPVGSSVTVYYYPDDPQKSALIAGVPNGVYTILFTSLCAMLFGLAGIGYLSGFFHSKGEKGAVEFNTSAT